MNGNESLTSMSLPCMYDVTTFAFILKMFVGSHYDGW